MGATRDISGCSAQSLKEGKGRGESASEEKPDKTCEHPRPDDQSRPQNNLGTVPADAVGSMVTVTGWGKPSDSAGGISPVLREVRDIPVITNSDCNDVYGIVGDGVVCIDTTGGRGSCNGDSGGPLVQMAGGKAAGDK